MRHNKSLLWQRSRRHSSGDQQHNTVSKLTSALIGLGMITLGGAVAPAYAQQVALLDSGVDPDRGFNLANGFNYITNSSDTSDMSKRPGEGHGTISARLVAEAFSGQIVPFVVSDDAPGGINEGSVRSARDSALSDILGRSQVKVVGITWGTSGVAGASASLMPQLSNAGKVIAIMAGNEISSQPNTLATSSFNLPGVIIVGATDGNGVLLPESNRAGTTKNRYVAANGLPGDGATYGGTSWAAARISGIAGAVLQQNPNLTGEQVADVIFKAAEDRGAPGIDDEYGRGVILNAQQVLNTVMGPVDVPTDPEPSNSGGGGSGAGAALLLGGALVGALLLMRKPKSKLEKTLVLDSYGRGFQLDLSEQIEINDDAFSMHNFFNSLEQVSVTKQVSVPELNTEVALVATNYVDPYDDMIAYFAMDGDDVSTERGGQAQFALSSQLTESSTLTAGYNVSPRFEHSGVAQLDSNLEFGKASFLSGQAFSSLLSGFSDHAESLSVSFTPRKSPKTSFKLGLVSIDEETRYKQDSFTSLLEGSYQFTDNAGLSVQFGQLEEKGSVFGSGSGGIFGVKTATTYAVNLTGKVKLNKHFSLVGNYGAGKTRVDAADNSLLKDFSTLDSDWYAIGLVGNNVFRKRDQFGVAVSQPLKVRSGDVAYSIPTGRFANGHVRFDTERVNLANTNATETSVDAYYRTKLSDRLELGGFMSFRHNPNHVSDYGDDTIVMATLRYSQ